LRLRRVRDGIVRPLARRASNLVGALDSIDPLPIVALFGLCLLVLARSVPLGQDADGILPAIMSLQKLSVYFWAQDRFGNLLPLLTAWIRNPFDNLHAQIFLRLMAGLAAPLFFCSLVFRRPTDVWRATLLSDCLLLIVGGAAVMHETFVEALPYGTSLTCAGLAAMALRAPSGRFGARLLTLAAAVGLLVAYIVNYGLVVVALPLVGLFALLFPSVHATRLLVLHVMAATAGSLLPVIVAPDFSTDLGLAPDPRSFARYAAVIFQAMQWPFILAALLPPALLLLYLRLSRRLRALRLCLVIIAAMLGVAVLTFGVIASSRWLAMNEFHLRYFVPGYLLLISIGGLSLWLLARFAIRDRIIRGAAFVGLATVLLLTAHYRSHARGVPSRDIIGAGKGDMARVVAARYVARSLDGIAGDYWDVWPAVLLAEQYQYDVGYAGSNVLGITSRGGARRSSFAARLAAQGRLRLICIDWLPAECAAYTSLEMGVPGLRFSESGPMERIPGDHRLWLVEITVAENEK
jgi:hypothetical protein